MAPGYSIDVAALPDIGQPAMDFLDTSFFQSAGASQAPPQLPTAASIISRHGDGGSRVVIDSAHRMAVKIGSMAKIRLEEVQTMRAVRRILPQGHIAIPEVFGWRRHGKQIFIYMSLVDGRTLRQVWPSLTSKDKTAIQLDLRNFVSKLRQIVSENPQQIASVSGGLVQDRFFWPEYARGPFSSIKAYNDWIFAAATRHPPNKVDQPIKGLDHPYMFRDMLPDDTKVYFTHADLVPLNIMVVGRPGSYRVSAILDWEQAGWYPEYWEYCKMHFGAGADDEWTLENWPGKITEPNEHAFSAFSEYYEWRSGGL